MPEWIFIPISILCAAAVIYRYHLAGRLTAGGGWAAMILAIGGFGSGIVGSFAWSGLIFLFVGGCGLIIVLQDAAIRRRSRRHRHSRGFDLERNS